MSLILLSLVSVLQPVLSATNSTTLTLYVRPDTVANISCPSPCYTLSQYAQYSLGFPPQVVMKFLPGEHFLDREFMVVGLNKLVLCGTEGNPNSVVINIGNNLTIVYTNEVEVYALSITGLPKSTFFEILDSIDILLYDLVITNCSGTFVIFGNKNKSVVAKVTNVLVKDNNISEELFAFEYVTLNFSKNMALKNIISGDHRGALLDIVYTDIKFSNNMFMYNTKRNDHEVSLMFVLFSQMVLKGTNNFTGNTAQVINTFSSFVLFEDVTKIVSNQALYGAILLENSSIIFAGNTSFVRNKALTFGGALVLSSDSYIYFVENSSVIFDRNTAGNRGGAIYVFGVRACFTSSNPACSFYFFGKNFSLEFSNNVGQLAGDDIYGGNLESCSPEDRMSIFLNSSNVKVNHKIDTLSPFSSDPIQVCLCDDFGILCCPNADGFPGPKCPEVTDTGIIFPGQNLTIQLLAVGQLWGATPAEIRAVHGSVYTSETDDRLFREVLLGSTMWLSGVNATCTTISHSLPVPTEGYLLIQMFPDNVCDIDDSLVLRVNFSTSCPPGFMLSNETCQCNARLKKFTGVFCDINQQTIQHTGNMWVGYHKAGSEPGLIIHSSACPFDYCISGPEVTFDLNNTDLQCDHNRSGHLCGQCNAGLSEMFGGTSECQECSNAYLALLIPFSLAGIALLVFIFLLRLTVDYGTLNGLIFFANIIQVNRTVFIPNRHSNILTVFIAWLNLDLGIETCFYNGMDAYGKMWLQFVFPFYIWALCGFIIFLSSRSMRMTKLLGSNPVAVLATLFLLSYLKVFRTIIAAFSVTVLEYPDKSTSVWVLDGNIEMDSSKHVALFIFALIIFLVLFIPYTFLLVFDQWLQRFSNWKLLSWAKNHKLRAFLDTYHAPYKGQHRYWTGLLLVFRIILAIVNAFAVAYNKSYSFKLFSIVGIVFFCLFWVGKVYRKWPLYVLESSFLINLGLLALAMYHVRSSNNYREGNEVPYVDASISIALITFVGILIYHLYMISRKSKLVRGVTVHVKNKLHAKDDETVLLPDDSDVTVQQHVQQQKPIVSSTVVELREPLLDDDTHT